MAALQRTQEVQSLGVLAAGIAHELNTPLQFVTDNLGFLQDVQQELGEGFVQSQNVRRRALASPESQISVAELLELCREPEDPDLLAETREAVSESLDGLSRMSTIVSSIRAVTHGGNGERRPFDLRVMILNALAVSTSAWKMYAEVETDFEEGLPKIVGDEGALGQVFLNLIVNAAHAIEQAPSQGEAALGRVRIATRREREFVEVRVSDSGDGIPKNIRSRIFDPFFTTKEVGKGTGQGLAISRSVVSKHGGDITFETQLGQGTTFVVRLPLQAA